MSNIWDICTEIKGSLTEEKEKDNKLQGKIETEEEFKCENCGSKNYIKYNNEKIICEDCNLVAENIIDYSQEWRYYGSNDNKRSSDPTRCGAPTNPLFKKPSLTTCISGRGFEKFKRLNQWNGLSYEERRLIQTLNFITKIAKKGNLPTCVVDKTIVIYNKVSEDQIRRGKSLTSIMASAFWLSLNLHSVDDIDITRTMEEIAELFKLKAKKLKKGCNECLEILNRKLPEFVKKIKPTKPKDLITRFCAFLSVDNEYRKKAFIASQRVNMLGICQKNNAKSIAVGVIYLISQIYRLGLTKKLISSKCGTSEVTINNTYLEMYRFKKFLLD